MRLDNKKIVQLSCSLRSKPRSPTVVVHMGTCGIASGAQVLLEELQRIVKEESSKVVIKTSGCAGLCSLEPMITVFIPGQPPVKYCQLNIEKLRRIYDQHVRGGNPVGEYALAYGCETVY